MPLPDDAPVTEWLIAWGQGDQLARERLMEAVYGDLRRRAAAFLRRERQAHTLQPTALVHEAFLRLVDQSRASWKNRAQFLAVAARMMRRVLVDHARARGARKRDAGLRVSLDDAPELAEAGTTDVDLLALDQALQALAALDERQATIVELRYFAGLTVEEAAEVLDVSPATVKRDWVAARAWLFQRLRGSRP